MSTSTRRKHSLTPLKPPQSLRSPVKAWSMPRPHVSFLEATRSSSCTRRERITRSQWQPRDSCNFLASFPGVDRFCSSFVSPISFPSSLHFVLHLFFYLFPAESPSGLFQVLYFDAKVWRIYCGLFFDWSWRWPLLDTPLPSVYLLPVFSLSAVYMCPHAFLKRHVPFCTEPPPRTQLH